MGNSYRQFTAYSYAMLTETLVKLLRIGYNGTNYLNVLC